MRGCDDWIGRDVVKKFGELGNFTGKVIDVDEHDGKAGCRLFHVVYQDDDDEWLEPTEIQSILVPDNQTPTTPIPATVNCLYLFVI